MPELRSDGHGSGNGAAAVDAPRIVIAPAGDDRFIEAVESGGGVPLSPDEAARADGVIWTDPHQPAALGELLGSTDASWVQLPFAGIERFFGAGVMDPQRTWTCAKGIYGAACAEHALMLMLAASRRLHEHVGATSWRPGGGGAGAPEQRLAGATVLIVGTGGIARALVPLLSTLSCRIVAVNRSGAPLDGAHLTEKVGGLPRLLTEADYVVLAAALTPETDRLFDAAMLEYMRPSAWLINVARGGLVDTDSLVRALERGELGGAALDVTDPEPLPEGHPLWTAPNAIITPHVANTWAMALPELAALVSRNIRAFASGRPLEGRVDVEAGY